MNIPMKLKEKFTTVLKLGYLKQLPFNKELLKYRKEITKVAVACRQAYRKLIWTYQLVETLEQ